MKNRLNSSVVDALRSSSQSIVLPSYDRAATQAGIVHLGIGAFHRAHQAFYTEKCLNADGGNWGIIGASLRSASVKNQLHPQEGLYTLIEKGADGERFQIIGAVKDVIVGPENQAALIEAMAKENIKIVSLTVTEKGYCHDPATGNLNLNHPDIAHDLKNPNSPKSSIGYIVAALRLRKRKGIKSFTCLSCDNLPNNGKVLENAVKQFASRTDEALLDWIQRNTTFPSTMIDRIVPATTDADREMLFETLGYSDEGAVVAEPFTQWVVEDKFCNERPAWEKVGVQLTDDVDTFEKIKLRLLNGSHSTLAYTGYLSGYETISEVMTDPAFVNMISVFMNREAGETVTAPAGFDIDNYKSELLERFTNPGLKHRTWQIAMDGSQKLPQRLLGTLRDQLGKDQNIDIICLGVAAWIRYVSGVNEAGNTFEVSDPLAAELASVHENNKGDIPSIVEGILSIREVFGSNLIDEARFVHRVTYWLEGFYRDGVRKVIHDNFG